MRLFYAGFFLSIAPWLLASALAADAGANSAEAWGATPLSAPAVQAIDGESLRLADGTLVVLAGIEAPQLNPGWPRARPWPLAEAARAALAALAVGKPLHLALLARPSDRTGRLQAQVFDAAGHWLQAEMLRQGMARVYLLAEVPVPLPKAVPAPPADAGVADMVTRLLAEEQAARAAGRGIWALNFYQVLTPAAAVARGEGYRLVEGRVAAVDSGRQYTFLQLGTDPHRDLHLVIRARDRRQLQKAGLHADRLVGRTLRVRGWLSTGRTPEIAVAHAQQIELAGQ